MSSNVSFQVTYFKDYTLYNCKAGKTNAQYRLFNCDTATIQVSFYFLNMLTSLFLQSLKKMEKT